MRNTLRNALFAALFCSLYSVGANAANDLVVKVTGVQHAEGNVRLALYDRARHFEKEKRAITVREALASSDPVVITIRDLPAGDYAIHAFHDEDGDHNFDHMLGMWPREGYGYSVNADTGAEESFENASFTHGGDSFSEVSVHMRYCGTRDAKSVGKTLSCWISLSP